MGPMGSGKTALFYRLVLGPSKDIPRTVTSQVPNEDEFSPSAEQKAINLVDFPGHDSQWPAAVERMQQASGVIFLIDATEPNINVAGQKLFDLMSDPKVKLRRVPFLVACNKSEEAGAKKVAEIEDELLEDLRDRMEMKDTIEDTEGNVIQKTLVNEEDDTTDMFEFEHAPCPVNFAAVSVKNKELAPIIKFCMGRS
eukprot:CAMPEP_0184485222 /NCGR_PEP_ID=MMETSP0113_2-20130426/6859_1 /TAXON_ID=91329 /ORGANISM="Norrisiella sphaerica, Strain BC52" /LENGTH=196 /DNA_ID=CAMNT_0026866585 /DNA_START=216 /DNA_END=806 /DNA_ORIENTATION=-